jgi:hypothetical protein
LTKDGHRVTCELRVDGEWGTDVQLFRNGRFYGSRRFPTYELAQRYAIDERAALERDGWRPD